MRNERITRRRFIKNLMTCVASISLSESLVSAHMAQEGERLAILYNGFNCVGCQLCQQACKERNGLPKEFEPYLSPRTYVYVSAGVRGSREVRVRYSCMHCGKAPCLEACPVRAINRSRSGFVYIDQRKCIGCQYCVVACHYGVPKFDTTRRVSSKCHGCFDLVEKGGKPACVEICPWNALKFGKRSDMVKLARSIAAEKNGYIYGLREANGLGVVYVLPINPEEAGIFPRVRKEETMYPPEYTYVPILMVLMPIIGYYAVKEYMVAEGEEK